jgi:hypothetical protein
MSGFTEQDRLNEAFERALRSSWSDETRQEITQFFGEEITVKARSIYAEIMHCPVDWRVATIDSALPLLGDFLDANYPWLTAVARRNLNYAFIMTWK